MAGTTRNELAIKALEKFNGQSFFIEDLKGIIRRNLTGNEKTVLDYLFLMRSNNLIEEFETYPGSNITKWLVKMDEEPQEQAALKRGEK